MSRQSPKQALIDELGELFRISGNQENAFDNLAAQKLRVNRTDLNCLDVIQRIGPLTAGELATETGLTTGAVTAVIDRLERAGFARRTRDSHDRRRVMVEGTRRLFEEAMAIWGPMKAEWDAIMAKRTTAELELLRGFLEDGIAAGSRHAERLRSELDADGES